jgi:hypothetical protein
VNEANNLLSQLRDIHAAADPGWWPPAPGWWLLAVLLAGLTALALRQARRRWLVLRRRRKLFAALDAIAGGIDAEQDPQAYLASMNRLFRVVALRAFPASACARLQGAEWVGFIRSLLPQEDRVGSLAALATGPYQPRPQFDARGLHALARIWVTKYG